MFVFGSHDDLGSIDGVETADNSGDGFWGGDGSGCAAPLPPRLAPSRKLLLHYSVVFIFFLSGC